jgi:DNA-binding response OmpR family regulator
VENAPPDLILLDLMMPNMDGFEVAERLHRDERWRTIPVVVVTAKELTEEDRRRLNGSVLRVVRKGGGPEDLVQSLGDLTGRRAARAKAPPAEGGEAAPVPAPAPDEERGQDARPPEARKDLHPDPPPRRERDRDREKGKGRGSRAANGES